MAVVSSFPPRWCIFSRELRPAFFRRRSRPLPPPLPWKVCGAADEGFFSPSVRGPGLAPVFAELSGGRLHTVLGDLKHTPHQPPDAAPLPPAKGLAPATRSPPTVETRAHQPHLKSEKLEQRRRLGRIVALLISPSLTAYSPCFPRQSRFCMVGGIFFPCSVDRCRCSDLDDGTESPFFPSRQDSNPRRNHLWTVSSAGRLGSPLGLPLLFPWVMTFFPHSDGCHVQQSLQGCKWYSCSRTHYVRHTYEPELISSYPFWCFHPTPPQTVFPLLSRSTTTTDGFFLPGKATAGGTPPR